RRVVHRAAYRHRAGARVRDTRPVSQQDVEFVRGFFEGSVSADKEALLEMLPQVIEQTCDPEIEWVEDPQRADGRTYRGHAGVRVAEMDGIDALVEQDGLPACDGGLTKALCGLGQDEDSCHGLSSLRYSGTRTPWRESVKPG